MSSSVPDVATSSVRTDHWFMTTTVRHWLPIITFCPVNNLPDLIYVSVEFRGFAELYKLRKEIRKAAMWKRMYMEDICKMLSEKFSFASAIEVRLAFNRHVVRIECPF